MGRLKALRPALGVLPQRLAPAGESGEADRQGRPHWHGWYKTQAWRRLSWSVRLEAAFTCALCGRVEGRSCQTVADHIRPHRGDERLFWDGANLQCLCKACHDGAKQSEERRRPG